MDNSGNSELYMPVTINMENDDEPDAPIVSDIETLSQNYPNPFNPETTIKYNVEIGKKLTIIIYNIKGEKIKTLVNGISTGKGYTIWDGKDSNGKIVPSGVYFYKLITANSIYSKKMILLK